VTRKGQRLRLPVSAGEEVPAYSFESLDYPIADRRMDAYFAEFTGPTKPSKPHQHGGAEFIYVLSGRLNVNVDGENVALDAGDAMYFDSNVPHSYRRGSDENCSAIVVTTP
jgi:mannose-6-phosphate isomerase-like protein (cupin superfamily)